MVRKVTLIVACSLISACGAMQVKSVHDFCLLSQPIYPSRSQDKLSTETKQAISAHDEQGAKLCDWKPPKP